MNADICLRFRLLLETILEYGDLSPCSVFEHGSVVSLSATYGLYCRVDRDTE